MDIFNTTTHKMEELNLCNEYDSVSDMTGEVVATDDNIKWNADEGRWEANQETLDWWKEIEEYDEEFAELLRKNNITVSQFQLWCESQDYKISGDIESIYRNQLDYLKEMIEEYNPGKE